MSRSKDIAGIYRFIAYTPGSGAFEQCRAVVATTAGTINCTDANGNNLTGLPVLAGPNPYQLINITASSGTGNLFLGY